LTARRAALLAGFIAFIVAAALLAAHLHRDRNKVVYVNETAEKKYDRALRASARWFNDRTGINLGIVLIEQLPPDETIERHADALFSKLKLGRRSDGKALLFLWSERERRFKIEVSYDLEPVFPDALCKRLEEGARTFMLSGTPFARRDFIVELNVTMMLHYKEFERTGRLPDFAAFGEPAKRYVGGHLAGGAGIVGRGYSSAAKNVQDELKPLAPELEEAMQPGVTPEETMERYLRSLELGIGVPNVPLLTEASRYFRMDKPHAPGYLRRIRGYMSKAMPYRITVQGDLAVANFKPGNPLLPVFLRRDEKGRWLIDEPKVWASVHLFQDGSSGLKYLDSPYAFGIVPQSKAYEGWALFMRYASPPLLAPMPTRIRERLQQAEAAVRERPRDVAAWIALADILHFEIYWLQATEAVYGRILEMDPGNEPIRWRLLDVTEMTSDVERENVLWCELLRAHREDGFIKHGYKWFRKSFYVEDPKTNLCRDESGKVIPLD
jgi:hypothetical protein